MLRKILIALVLIVLLLVLGVVYLVAQAQIYFPQTGEYKVGRLVLSLLDESREESFTEASGDNRAVQASIYYPIDAEIARPVEYLEAQMIQPIVAYSGMPEIAYDWIHHNSHSAPAAEGRFPVLIFSPGFGNLPQFYSSLLEGIASEGYIVVALGHSYSTGVVAFADGTVMQANELGSAAFLNASDEASREAEERRIRAVWVEDMRFVLERLPELNGNDFIHGAMDTERIGLIGHSFGGKALTEALALEPRFLAGVNLDGGAMLGEFEFEQPYLLMLSDLPVLSPEQMQSMGITQERLQADWNARLQAYAPILESSESGYAITLLNSAHNSFMTDFTLAPSIYRFAITEALVGRVDGQAAYEAIRQESVDFFDAWLKGEAYTAGQNPLFRIEQSPEN